MSLDNWDSHLSPQASECPVSNIPAVHVVAFRASQLVLRAYSWLFSAQGSLTVGQGLNSSVPQMCKANALPIVLSL